MTRITSSLALAAVTLVCAGDVRAEKAWSTDISYLSYVESRNRSNVEKVLWDLTRSTEDATTTVQLIHDTMSGASPTGSIRGSEGSVTYTGASGSVGSSTSNPDESVAKAFDDTRTQVSVDHSQLLSRLHTLRYSVVHSFESDYESYGGSVGIKRESATKNTAIDVSLAATVDSISRSYSVGTPEPLSNLDRTRNFSEGERNTIDGVLGFTQILNRNTLAQLTLSYSQSEGYHTDPYKVISAADDDDRIAEMYTENRPESRRRLSAFTKVVHQLKNTKNTLHFGYRLYADDWGVNSNTLEARYHRQISSRHYIEPHVRLYHQRSADFYRRKLDLDENRRAVLPEDGFASADYRLDAMTSLTVGAKYGFKLTPKTTIRCRVAYLQQQYSSAQFSENTALIMQTSLNYAF